MVSHMQHEGENLYQPDETDTRQVTRESSEHTPTKADAQQDSDAITWTASEFIAHHKTSSWYLFLFLGALLIALLVWLVTRDPFPTVSVFVGVALLGIYASHMPHQESYRLDAHGIVIGSRHYLFGEFRSFAVIPEGAFRSIQLTPLRHFAMYTTMYIDPSDEDKIIDRLSQHLPMEEVSPSLVDNLMRRIHF